jgi:hypothetical protein
LGKGSTFYLEIPMKPQPVEKTQTVDQG